MKKFFLFAAMIVSFVACTNSASTEETETTQSDSTIVATDSTIVTVDSVK